MGADPDRLREDFRQFAGGMRAVKIRSETLNDTILLVSDNYPVTLDKDGRMQGCVVYRATEMAHLTGKNRPTDEDLLLLHTVKAELHGQILPPNKETK